MYIVCVGGGGGEGGYTCTTYCVFTLYILSMPGPILQQSDKFATEVMMLESQLDSADKSNK